MTTALASLGSALAGSFSREKSGETQRPKFPEISTAIATVKDRKTRTAMQRQADQERVFALLAQPEVLGLLMTIGGIYLSNNIRFHSNDASNAVLQSTATTASALMGLGYAGVGDLASTIVALTAGGGSLLGNLAEIVGGDLANPDSYGWNPLDWPWPLGFKNSPISKIF